MTKLEDITVKGNGQDFRPAQQAQINSADLIPATIFRDEHGKELIQVGNDEPREFTTVSFRGQSGVTYCFDGRSHTRVNIVPRRYKGVWE